MNPQKDFLFSKGTFRKKRRRKARRAVDRRQDRSIHKLYKLVKNNKERKFIDQQLTTTISTTWGNLLTRPLSYIPQGQGEGQRIGNQVMIKRIQFKTQVSVGDTFNTYRILIVRFGHTVTASLGIQNILQNYSNTTPFQILGFFRRNAPSKYKVLYDSGVKTLVGNGTSAQIPVTARSIANHNIVLKFPKGILVQYSDATASSETNGFTYVVAVTDSAIAPHVGFQSMSRVIFTG